MKKQMTAVFLSIAVLVLCMRDLGAEESGSGFLTVGNYTLMSKKRVNRNVYDFTFRAEITNSGTADVRNVSAVLTDGAVFNEVTDGEVVFGDVPAGGSVTGSDTFTVRINRLYTFDGSRIRWDIRYSSDTPPRVVMGAGMDFMEIPIGESDYSLGITAEFTSYDTDPHTLVFTQTVSPDNGGISLVRDFKPEYSVSTSMLFILGTGITANAEGTYTLTTAVKIAGTGLTAQVSVTVDVLKKETPSLLGTLAISPAAISISEPADVKFSVGLKTRLKPEEVSLEETDEAGNPLRTLGRLGNDGTSGDILADDFVWAGRFGIDSGTEGRLFFRAKAVFPDTADPVYTAPAFLGIIRFPIGVTFSDISEIVTDPETGERLYSNEVNVWFREGTDPDTIEDIAAAVDGTVAGTIYGLGLYQIKFPGTGDTAGVYNAINILKGFPEVEKAVPEFFFESYLCSYIPGDSSFLKGEQRGLERMRTDEAWVIAGGRGIIVGVADTGIDYGHPDLFDKAVGIRKNADNTDDIVIDTAELYPDDPYDIEIYPNIIDRVKDYYGHGTAMAGIISAIANNDTGKLGKNMIGVAWESQILPLKICYKAPGEILTLGDRKISVTLQQLPRMIEHAVKNYIKIINYSGYVVGNYDLLEKAVHTAVENDVLIVAAAASVDPPPYLASYSDTAAYESLAPNVLSVDTCNSDEEPDGSALNPEANIVAPGIGALVTHPTYDVYMTIHKGYDINYDTYDAPSPSAATAMASGAAAVVWSAYPELTAAEVKKRLMFTGKLLSVTKLYKLTRDSITKLEDEIKDLDNVDIENDLTDRTAFANFVYRSEGYTDRCGKEDFFSVESWVGGYEDFADKIRTLVLSRLELCPAPNQGRGLRRLDLFDALFNGNFDAGLSGWERLPYAGVKVIPALEGEDALLGPYKRMAYLSTEPLESGQEDTGTASLSRSFPIRNGVKEAVISFDYNFSMYESSFMAGLGYNDVFKAVLKLYGSTSDEGETTLLEKTALSESFTYIKPGVLYGKKVTMRISGWKHAAFSVTIPQNVCDKGGNGLLEFSLRNIEDSNYDSFVRITNIRFKDTGSGFGELLSLNRLLRLMQLFNTKGYHCDTDSEDGYAPGAGEDHSCGPHPFDYDENWRLDENEIQSVINING